MLKVSEIPYKRYTIEEATEAFAAVEAKFQNAACFNGDILIKLFFGMLKLNSYKFCLLNPGVVEKRHTFGKICF